MIGRKNVIPFVVIAVAIGVGGNTVHDVYAETTTSSDIIGSGIFIDSVNVSQMTKEEAESEIEKYIGELGNIPIQLVTIDDNSVSVKASDFGLSWANREVLDEAAELGKTGNVLERYKAIKDLEFGNKVFDIQLDFDDGAIRQIIADQCTEFDQEAVDATLVKNGSEFSVQSGQKGIKVSVDESVTKVKDYLTGFWNKSETLIDLVVMTDEPRGNEEELKQLKDVLGTFSTTYKSSTKARVENVANGARLINGMVLYPGDTFSAYEVVSPFTEENGYYMAGSYLNGKVVDSLGGGICQVSTTLYNAVLLAELEIVERSPHSMIVNYVEPSSDAAIAGTYKDFKFKNDSEYPIYIEGTATDSRQLTFTIYGVETRDSNRKVKFESNVLEETEMVDLITPDLGLPAGTMQIQSGHKGMVAELWKIVEEDGKEVSRERVNKSNYQMSPRTAIVGMATGDLNVAAAIQTAVATGSIDYCKTVVGGLQAAAEQAAAAQAAAAGMLPIDPGITEVEAPID